jgi:hypothetical protein
MIHGPGVQMKYGAIVAGFQAELYAGLSKAQQELKSPELIEFLDRVRNGTLEEFEEWYQLYK